MTTHRLEIEDVGVTLRVPAMAEVVSQRLRRRIVRGELSEGDVLPPESELMTEFSVSRRPLREAFRVLESEGLLTVRRGVYGGAVVQIPNGDIAAGYASLVLEFRGTTLRDLLDALLVIESGCAALLARRSTPADIARLRDAHASAPASVSDGNAL